MLKSVAKTVTVSGGRRKGQSHHAAVPSRAIERTRFMCHTGRIPMPSIDGRNQCQIVRVGTIKHKRHIGKSVTHWQLLVVEADVVKPVRCTRGFTSNNGEMFKRRTCSVPLSNSLEDNV